MAAPEIPAWLKGLPMAPEYRPTETEFADPIAFISRIEGEAAAFGICKVIPPLPKPSKKFVLANLNRSLSTSPDPVPGSRPAAPSDGAVFTTRHQEIGSRRTRAPVHKQVWQSGEVYTLEQFEARSKAFARSQLGGFKEVSPLLVETLFWNATLEKPIYVEYANDVPGSGFAVPEEPFRYHSHRRRRQKRGFGRGRVQEPKCPCLAASSEAVRQNISVAESSEREGTGTGTAGWKLSNSPWNLQVIARAPGSLTRFMPDEVPGVTSPMVYIGMLFSWFAWHVEDHELHSLNFLHMGSPKTWYAVPGEYAATLEEIVRVQGYGGNVDRLTAFTMLGEKTTLLSPEVLVSSGVPCCRLVQHPGEFVVTFPRAYHVGFSHGFNCGEAANFATPQWLKVAKEAAVRRAAMSYLPMLSHQQLLYMLTVSFVSRVPRELLPGVRSSRLRDRKKEDREILVKKAFLDDMMNENRLLCDLLAKISTPYVVLWEPELLPLPCTGHQSYSSSMSRQAHGLVDDDDCRKAQSQLKGKSSFDCKEDDRCVVDADRAEADVNSISYQNVSCETQKNTCHPDCMSSQGGVMDSTDVDEDDLPFGLHVDSGSLACVACGILGYPFMAILQPSEKALKELFSLNCEESDLKLEKSESLGQPPHLPSTIKNFYSDLEKNDIKPEERRKFDLICNLSPEESGHATDAPSAIKEPSSYPTKVPEVTCESIVQPRADNRSGTSSLPNNSANDMEYLHMFSSMEVGEQNPQSENTVCAPRKDPECQHSNRLRSFDEENEYDGTVHTTANAIFQNDLCSSKFSSAKPLNKTDRLLGTTVARCCHENTKWNTSSEFLRSRIFCLQHALEIEELLQCKGGAHVLIICHSDYLKVKALAISIAEEIGIQFNCKDVPLENASPPDLDLINTSIDDEEHEEDGKDWTSKLGVNLKYCIKLRKQQPTNQEQLANQERLALSLGGIFSNPSPVSPISNLKWLCRKSRTQYKVIGTFQSKSHTDANTEESKPVTESPNVNPANEIQVYKSRKNGRNDMASKHRACSRKGAPKELDAYNDVAMVNRDDHRNTSGHTHQTGRMVDDSTDNLLTVPILIAEYPRMHRDGWATKKISAEHIIFASTKSRNLSIPVDSPVVSCESRPKIHCSKLSNKMIISEPENLETSHPYFNVPMLECSELEQDGVEGSMSRCKVGGLEKSRFEVNIVMLEGECSEVQKEERAVDGTHSEHEIHGTVKPVCEPTLRTVDRSEDLPEVMANLSNSEGSLGMFSLSEEQLTVPLLSSNSSEMHLNIPALNKSELKNMGANSAEGNIERQEELPAAREGILQGVVVGGNENQFTADNTAVKSSQIQQAAHLANDTKANCDVIDYLKSEYHSVNTKPVIDDSKNSANTGSVSVADGLGMQEVIENTRDMSLNAGSDNSPQNVERHNKTPTRVVLIQYVRRRNKRKREAEQIAESHNSCISFVRGPCEGLRPRTGRPAALMSDTSIMEKKVTPMKANKRPEKSVVQKGKDKGKEAFKCDVEGCQMSFRTRGELSLHKRNCCTYEGCGKRFHSHKYAMRHQCVHDDERPLKCPWKGCNMSFKWAWARTEHIRVHTGERPYKCKVSGCGQTFRFVSDFSRHRRKTGHYVNSSAR
ncbi:lysine-specific demethylase SE14 [Phoenix dactylifera]|uniref:Lysine-specific demethylase SE14 n=1 Tax=Phoenix dactylifera TaxID=42345 RepID=A0A8B7BFC2_PHODC|nr:lysine-specific demethylase SE14 [Phoenix dactylifera]